MAWLYTSLATLLPGILLVTLLFGGSDGAFLVSLYCGLVHGVSLLIVGLPIFLVFWPNPESRIWCPPVGVALGFLLGYGALLGVFGFWGASQAGFDSGVLFGSSLGGVYGALTAAVAVFLSGRWTPENSKNEDSKIGEIPKRPS